VNLRSIVHLLGHAALPAALARLVWPAAWIRSWLIMLAANLVDLDHLLANPVYDPNRCSVGFHPLHSWQAIACYGLLLLPRRGRVLAAGLLLHMLWDQVDCWWMAL
jgi:hypothetical protein